jgi:hypothetical protein
MDLEGSFTIRTPAKVRSISLLALTMIDPATVWFEFVEATNKSATSIQDLFHNTWYPQAQFIVSDNGIQDLIQLELKQKYMQGN